MEKEETEEIKKAGAKEKKEAPKPLVLFKINKKGQHISPTMNWLRFFFYGIHRLIYPFKRHGAYKVADGPCIYIGNHYCLWDIFYVAHSTKEGVHFLAKQSVLESFIGPFAKKCGVIGAMRDGTDVRTVMDSMKALKYGDKISLFPEGTRNKVSDEEFLPFFGGASLLAIKTKKPIIPMVICNRPHVFRMTHVMFGEPFELTEYYDRKLTPEDYAEADEKLRQKLYALREEYRAGVAEKKNKKK